MIKNILLPISTHILLQKISLQKKLNLKININIIKNK